MPLPCWKSLNRLYDAKIVSINAQTVFIKIPSIMYYAKKVMDGNRMTGFALMEKGNDIR
jgi:hypothetical protein